MLKSPIASVLIQFRKKYGDTSALDSLLMFNVFNTKPFSIKDFQNIMNLVEPRAAKRRVEKLREYGFVKQVRNSDPPRYRMQAKAVQNEAALADLQYLWNVFRDKTFTITEAQNAMKTHSVSIAQFRLNRLCEMKYLKMVNSGYKILASTARAAVSAT